ncbi:hypothetical protein SDJN02_14036, partial [Cucurbita argyrosperma subsp. argyrosperma]
RICSEGKVQTEPALTIRILPIPCDFFCKKKKKTSFCPTLFSSLSVSSAISGLSLDAISHEIERLWFVKPFFCSSFARVLSMEAVSLSRHGASLPLHGYGYQELGFSSASSSLPVSILVNLFITFVSLYWFVLYICWKV